MSTLKKYWKISNIIKQTMNLITLCHYVKCNFCIQMTYKFLKVPWVPLVKWLKHHYCCILASIYFALDQWKNISSHFSIKNNPNLKVLKISKLQNTIAFSGLWNDLKLVITENNKLGNLACRQSGKKQL
jgi:hypothetical protein